MNVYTCVGRMVSEPELVSVGEKSKVLNFVLAIDEFRKDEKVAHFFDFEAWDSGAETIAKFVKKGDQLAVTGMLRQHKWEDANGKRQKVVVRVTSFTLIGNKKEA